MSKFWHLVKFNILFNSVRIIFLSVLSLILLGLCSYFYDEPKEMGGALMQYCFYIMFMIFTGKMNSKNSMMFDIKHLMAMPMTKKEIVLLKSFADSFQMLPIALVFLYGFSLSFPQYHVLMAAIILYLVISFGNIIAFNKRIDFSRMQHSKTSFKNSFLFLHKFLEMFLQIIFVTMAVGLVNIVFAKNIFMQEYGFLILIATGVFLAGSSTLKMLKDETRSYFIFKRDVIRIGWKIIVVVVPLVVVHKAYKTENLLKNFENMGLGQVGDTLNSKYKEKVNIMSNLSEKTFLLTILNKDTKGFNEYINSKKEIPWEKEIMGSYPPHIAAGSDNLEILKTLIELKPDVVNLPGKFKKKTPLYSALRYCQLSSAQLLIDNGANIDHRDIDGNSPMIYAASRKCYGGVLLLKQHGAKVNLENLKGKTAMDFIPAKSGIKFFLNTEEELARGIASEKKITSSKDLIGPRQQESRLQQK